MPHVLSPADEADLVRLYLKGETGLALAERFGVGKSTVYRALERGKVTLRRLPMHEARHLAGASRPELERRARTRELNLSQSSPLEAEVAQALAQRCGFYPVAQKAIGPYNVDLFIEPVAIEVWGGGWHGHGAHLQRFHERTREILDAGWWQVVLWCHPGMPFVGSGADEVIARVEIARSDPSAKRENWVLWGNGQPVRTHRFNVD